MTDFARFRRLVWRYYRAHGRHDLPWRKTHDLYRILVSEIMLQQTQVERVIPFYNKFIKQFPTAKRLAGTSLAEVIKAWQGLGLNRRAKFLREAAGRLVSTTVSGARFNLVQELEALPGVGPYTARAVATFVYNQDGIVIETNIRTAIIHHFFPGKKKISDRDIETILLQVLPKGRARAWYSALMDYGAHLKRSGISHNARGKRYGTQARFSGSLREVRGALLRELSHEVMARATLMAELELRFGIERRAQIDRALADLSDEGLIEKRRGHYRLAE